MMSSGVGKLFDVLLLLCAFQNIKSVGLHVFCLDVFFLDVFRLDVFRLDVFRS